MPEYWIVNVQDGSIEVLRDPDGEFWGARSVHGPGETLRPLELADVTVDVDALLAFVAG